MISLKRLLDKLECYLQDDIGQLMEEGYQDRPGSAINSLHELLDSCIYWQKKISDNEI